MASKTLGIIGGMGPEATVDLMMKIIKSTPAKVEQDHIHVIADNNPHVPPRVEAIMADGESAGPAMVAMGENLERAGADFLVIACNTAHYYYDDVAKAVNIPVLHMVDEAVKVLKRDGIRKAALLATAANIHIKLYDKGLESAGIELVLPDEEYQQKVLKTIAAIKAGRYTEADQYTDDIAAHCQAKGAEAIILGCTELPMAFHERSRWEIPFYDPAEIIAEVVVEQALKE